jgi:hypothetical protein
MWLLRVKRALEVRCWRKEGLIAVANFIEESVKNSMKGFHDGSGAGIERHLSSGQGWQKTRTT